MYRKWDGEVKDNIGHAESSLGEPLKSSPGLWQRAAGNPLLTGNGGDVQQVTDPCVLLGNGVYHLWCSCVGTNTDRCQICYSTSPDGLEWSAPRVVLEPSEPNGWDDSVVESPTVVLDDAEPEPARRYKMWYVGGNRRRPRETAIGIAYSSDGLLWRRLGPRAPIIRAEGRGPGDMIGMDDPCVLRRNDHYEMWYCSWASETELSISYALSQDGMMWRKHPSNPVLRYAPDMWEAGGWGVMAGNVSQPAVLWDEVRGIYRMWYGSYDDTSHFKNTGFGYAESEDGIRWQRHPAPVFLPHAAAPGEGIGLARGPFVLQEGRILRLYYGGIEENLKLRLCGATCSVEDASGWQADSR